MILGDAVAEFRGSGGRLTGAVTRAGREIEAELAIVGVGVQPSTGYLEGSGVDLERGTVLVDERFATNVPGIWAVGDIANFHDPVFGHRRLIQHWTNANHQGQRLGRLLAGEDTPYDQVAFFFSEVFGTKLGLLGDLDGGHDELVMRGSLEDGRPDRLVPARRATRGGADRRPGARGAGGAERPAARPRPPRRPRGAHRSRRRAGRGLRDGRVGAAGRWPGAAGALGQMTLAASATWP